MPRAAALALQDAFAFFEDSCLISDLPDEQQPSALLVTFRPEETPNSKVQIQGDPYVLARVLLLGAQDEANPHFREAMIGLIPDLLNLAE